MKFLLLLLLSIPSSAQERNDNIPGPPQPLSSDAQRLDGIESNLNSFLFGRQTITGVPSFLNGYKCTNTSGTCITFQDGTTQNTAPSSNVLSSNTYVMLSYSSGTTQNFTAVFNASTTYHWLFNVSVTSGTNSTNSTFICTVNSDATTTHYFQALNGYPNAYTINNAGATASYGLNACGGGAVQAGDYIHGDLYVQSVQGQSTFLQMEGNIGESCQGDTILQVQKNATLFKGAGPWTLTCRPTATQGWTWESQVFISSPTPTIIGPTGAQGPSGTFGGSGTTNAVPYFTAATTLGALPIPANGGIFIGTTGTFPSTGPVTGTANQIIVTNAPGKITLSTPQDIGTGSSVSFGNLTLTTPLALAYLAPVAAIINIDATGGTGSPANTSENTLKTYSMPGGTMANNGDLLRITATYRCTANTDTKRIRLYFGSTVIADSGITILNGTTFMLTGYIARTGTASQFGITQAVGASTHNIWTTGLVGDVYFPSAPAETMSGAITIKSTVQLGLGTLNDVIQDIFEVEYLSAGTAS